jgi:transcription termination/antitermination protein NusG
MAESAKWYIVHTYSGYENKVAQTLGKMVENRRLSDLIQEITIPTETVVEIKDNKRREIERKIFPGYVFVKMIITNETWYIVRNTRGVTGFLGTTTKPVPLTQQEIDSLGVERHAVDVNFDVGDSVKISGGPLDGFVGTVEEIDRDKQTAKVKVSMFGRETSADVELAYVTLL